MELLNVSLGLAFLAGLASFFSPCVFSLVPAYVGYLSGRSLSEVQNQHLAAWCGLRAGVQFCVHNIRFGFFGFEPILL